MLHSVPVEGLENPEVLAQSLKVQANELYAQKRYTDAISLYSQAIDLVPSSPTYYSNRSAAYLMSQDFSACLKDCQEALERDEKMGKVWSRGLKCFMAMWEPQKAEDWIARGLEALKDEAHYSTLLKEAKGLQSLLALVSQANELRVQDPSQALMAIENAMMSMDPSLKASPWVPNKSRLENAGELRSVPLTWRILRAQALKDLGDLESAYTATHSILTQSPSWIEASALRAHLIYLLDKQPANQILTHLSKNLAMDPDCKSLKTLLKSLKRLEAIKSEGNEAFGQREWDKALEKYSEFLETSGADGIPRVKVLSNRANVYSKIDKHEEVVVDVAEALKSLNAISFPGVVSKEPTAQDCAATSHSALYLKLYLRRADCLMKMEKFEEAVRDYQSASEIQPGDREISQALASAKKALKMSLRKDYYKILGVPKHATEVEIKKSYRKLALQYHPDKQSGMSVEEKSEAEIKFKEIGEAYSILSDDRKRRMFDSGMDMDGSSSMGEGGMGGMPMDDLLQAFFAQQAGRGRAGGFGGGSSHFHHHGFQGGFRGSNGGFYAEEEDEDEYASYSYY